jgi:hypothetical protein
MKGEEKEEVGNFDLIYQNIITVANMKRIRLLAKYLYLV